MSYWVKCEFLTSLGWPESQVNKYKLQNLPSSPPELDFISCLPAGPLYYSVVTADFSSTCLVCTISCLENQEKT